MLKKAAALLLVCAGLTLTVSCVTSNSNYLYAALPAASEIAAYREDPNSGTLTILPISPITAGPGVQSLVIHPSRNFLYAANSGENDVSLFNISSDGALTEVLQRTIVGTGPTLLAMDSAGSHLYVGNSGSNNISVFSIDSKNGSLTQVAGSPFGVGISPLNMKLSPKGNFLYVSGSTSPTGVVEIWSVSAGVLSKLISVTPAGISPYGLAISPNGSHLYTANIAPDNSISEYTIKSDGTLSALAGSPLGEAFSSPVAVLVNNSGGYLYVANEGSSNVAGYSVGSAGGLTLLTNSPFTTNAQPISMATDSSGNHIFVGNQASSAAINTFGLDLATGGLTALASTSVGNTPTSIAITP